MTSSRTTPPRRARLGGWPVAVIAAAPLTALVLGAGPATGLGTDVVPTAEPTATTSTETPTPTPTDTPTDVPTATPTTTSEPTTAPEPTPTPTASTLPDLTSLLTALDPQGLRGGTPALALLGDPGTDPVYLATGAAAEGLAPFQTFRLAVQLTNDAADAVTLTPTLEFRVAGSGEFAIVPAGSTPGVPLQTSQEWLPADVGTTPAPETAAIPVDDFRHALPADLTPAPGQRSSGLNPATPYAVGPGTVTEQEFTVALSIDAAYATSYELRVTNAGEPIPGLGTAIVSVGPAPAPVTSADQRDGIDVLSDADPAAAQTVSTSGAPTYALLGPESAPPMSDATTYPLVADAADATATTTEATATAMGDPSVPVTVAVNGPGAVHSPGAGQCSVCHNTHTAQSKALVRATSETDQCYTCHAGGTGGADVRAQYALGQPENNPETRSYYSHDTTDPGDHVLDSNNEFAGKLSRHSQCSDCHDPHGATTAKAEMTPTGWTAPGGFTKVAGVAVTNGAAGTAPTYTWLDGMVQPVTAEYQLCFKCHTSFTTQPEDVPGKPSQRTTDLAVDFNPANPSYHPIEAPGRNQTQKLADSLAGPSSYKLWNFTTGDTIRCVSCHASNTTGTSADAAENAPDSTLTVHASTNRGILTRPYENRVLSAAGAFYDAKGAALCLTCHMDTPYMNRLRPAAAEGTNFVLHGLHMSGITNKGNGGLDIDTPGAGQGNARCAECHFSSHGTSQLPDGQTVTGERLVGFSPNVLPSKAVGGIPKFTKTATGGTCTLTCHGKDHQGARYTS